MKFASAYWQNPTNFAIASTTVITTPDLFPLSGAGEELPSDINWRELQKLCYRYCKTFGPLRASIDTKSALVAGKGFRVSSHILDVNEFLKDLFTHPRNMLIRKIRGWTWRMLSVCEVFILIVLDEEGNATVRALDENRIGEGKDSGLVTDPDDVTATMFYKYKSATGTEWIPDARFIYENEEILKLRLKNLGAKFDKSKISKTTASAKHKETGGYRRFILHWKNLTGIDEILRDTAPVSTTIEWVNIYVQAKKWEMDYKKALSSYAHVFGFGNSTTGEVTPEGRVLWAKWSKMNEIEKQATGLLSKFSPGTKLWIPPGMTHKIEAPNLPKTSGTDQDILNMAGAGARTPQDMYQGNSGDSTYASLKMSRTPLELEIEDIQYSMELFLRQSLIPLCGIAKIKIGGGKFNSLSSVADQKGDQYTLMPSYPIPWVDELKDGKPVGEKTINVEFWNEDIIAFEWPVVALTGDLDRNANALMGSQHRGVLGLGGSIQETARRLGVQNLNREARKRAIENEIFGEPVIGLQGDTPAPDGSNPNGNTPNGNGPTDGGNKPTDKTQPKPKPTTPVPAK